jgi:hypothetical protein
VARISANGGTSYPQSGRIAVVIVVIDVVVNYVIDLIQSMDLVLTC